MNRVLRLLILASAARSTSWTAVTPPTGWTWELPFAIQQSGRNFRVSPTFSLRAYANITVAKSYYVDGTSGNDADTGADWAHALATPEAAWQKADVDRVYLRNGYWFRNQADSMLTRSMEIIGDGTATISADCRNQVGAFSAVDNHYEATVSGSQVVMYCTDASRLTTWGKPDALLQKASVAEVDAAAGSWFQDGTTLYIRNYDDRAPDTNNRYLTAYGHALQADNVTMYYENVNFYGNTRWRNGTAAGGLKAYLYNCDILMVETAGCDEAIFQNCTIERQGGDGANHDARNGVVEKLAEIDCDYSCNGSGDASSQASTAHNGLSVLRIMGKYHHSAGQCVADAINCLSWCLGTEFYNSTSGIGFYSSGTAWLDSCYVHDCDTYDLQAETGATIYVRDFIGAKGVNNGTITPY